MLLLTCVSATLLTYLGETQITMNVKQSIKIDGNDWDVPVVADLGDVYAGCIACSQHTLTNDGCEGVWLHWDSWGEPDMEGITVTMRQAEECDEPILETLVIRHLDGIADDSFDVMVGAWPVYSYVDNTIGDETWITTEIDLTQFEIECCGPHAIVITATGEAWQHQATYGQLGIDWIELYCEGDVLCDSVDIGNEASEEGRTMEGWGPIEPLTSGGNWGGFDISGEDCRVTWVGGEQTTDAYVWLVCDNCCESEECGVEMDLPFYLEAESTIDFCLCYELHPLIQPMEYIVYSRLIGGVAP